MSFLVSFQYVEIAKLMFYLLKYVRTVHLYQSIRDIHVIRHIIYIFIYMLSSALQRNMYAKTGIVQSFHVVGFLIVPFEKGVSD